MISPQARPQVGKTRSLARSLGRRLPGRCYYCGVPIVGAVACSQHKGLLARDPLHGLEARTPTAPEAWSASA